jgi:hypothetical protein
MWYKSVKALLVVLFVLGMLVPSAMPAKAQSNVDLYANATFGGLYVGVTYTATMSRAYLKLKITTSRPITWNGMGSDVCTNPTTGFQQQTGQLFIFEGYVTNECDYYSTSMGFVYQDGDEPVDVSVIFQYDNQVWGETFYLGTVPIEVSVMPTSGRVGEEIIVPVAVDKSRGRSVVTLQTRVMFDYELYELVGYYPGIWPNASVNLVPNKAGDVTLGIRSAADWPLTTNGAVVLLRFKALKAGSAPIVLWELALETALNAEKIEYNAISGEVGVEDYVLFGGAVTYGGLGIPVPDVTVTLNQAQPVSTTTNEVGQYLFKLPNKSSVFPMYSKIGDNEAVSAFDAALAERCALDMPKLGYIGECVIGIVDVTGDGKITLLDSWYILRYSVGFHGESMAGQWRFEPGNVYFLDLTQDQNLDQIAYIIGDISMNWGYSTVVTASIPSATITATTNKIVVNIEGPSFYGMEFQIANNAPISLGAISAEGFSVAPNGHTIGISSSDPKTHAEIVINVDAPEGAEIMLINLKIDEHEPTGLAGTALVEKSSEQYLFLPVLAH